MATAMTSRERLNAALTGQDVDRVPIWFREGFPVVNGPADEGHFTLGWQADPLYRQLFDEAVPYLDALHGWGVPLGNRSLMIPNENIETVDLEQTENVHRRTDVIHTPRGDLKSISESHRNEATGWQVREPVQSLDDLRKLSEVAFDFSTESIEKGYRNYLAAEKQVGDRGLPQLFLSSPVVCISGCMPFELFLELSLTERKFFHELCEEVTRRQLAILDALYKQGPIDSVVTFGGSEQCTPPMMHPGSYDEYVMPYEGRLVKWLKERGALVTVHCHGKVKHALKCMVEEGVDGTDPVEPPPAGDVTYEEARKIAGDDLTLMGNIEFDRLEYGTPKEIREHVRNMLRHSNRRLILGASAGPITFITHELADNYRAWLEAALEFGN